MRIVPFGVIITWLGLLSFGQVPSTKQGSTVARAGSTWDFSAGLTKLSATTYAGLASYPAASYSGYEILITDCSTSACTAGGGTLKIKKLSDGSVWNVSNGVGNVVASFSVAAGDIPIFTGTGYNVLPQSNSGNGAWVLYGGTGANYSWGLPKIIAKKDGTLVMSPNTWNTVTGNGISHTFSDAGLGQLNDQSDVDYSFVQFNATCTESSASSITYTCATPRTPVSLAAIKGYPLNLTLTHAGAGGATTLKLDSVTGTKSLKQCDGTSNPTAAQLPIGRTIHPNYDATLDVFRMDGDCPAASSVNPLTICSKGEQSTTAATGAYAALTGGSCTLPTLGAGDTIDIVATVRKAGTNGGTCTIDAYFETYQIHDEINIGILYTFPATAQTSGIHATIHMGTATQVGMLYQQWVASGGSGVNGSTNYLTAMTIGASPVISIRGAACTAGDTLRVEGLTVVLLRAI